MKNEKAILYGIIGLFTGVLLTVSIASNAVNTGNTGMMQMMGMGGMQIGKTQNMMSSNIDRHFIEQMIPHHEDAITMAKMAQTKAQRPEIKNLAQAIIESQSKEINQMKAWYKSWFGEEVPKDEQVMEGHGMGQKMDGMHMGMMGDETDMKKLEQSEDFDKVFIEEMIPHHQMAVMMAAMLERGTNRVEMKQLAKDISQAQTKEINEMREWYKNWGY